MRSRSAWSLLSDAFTDHSAGNIQLALLQRVCNQTKLRGQSDSPRPRPWHWQTDSPTFHLTIIELHRGVWMDVWEFLARSEWPIIAIGGIWFIRRPLKEMLDRLNVSKIDALGIKVELEGRIKENRQDIQTIAQLARAVFSKDQLEILRKLSRDESVTTDTGNSIYYKGFKDDLLRLRGAGFIENRPERKGFAELEHSGGIQDARTYFQVRGEGKRFLSLLERLPPSPSEAE